MGLFDIFGGSTRSTRGPGWSVTSKPDIEGLVLASGIDPQFMPAKDANYETCTEQWVDDVLIPAYRQFEFDNNCTDGEVPANDCNKKANRGKTVAVLLYLHESQRQPDHALCFGLVNYIRTANNPDGEDHEINQFVVRDPPTGPNDLGQLRLCYVDFTLMRRVTLSQIELATRSRGDL